MILRSRMLAPYDVMCKLMAQDGVVAPLLGIQSDQVSVVVVIGATRELSHDYRGFRHGVAPAYQAGQDLQFVKRDPVPEMGFKRLQFHGVYSLALWVA